jgi:hypothetical protein
MVYDNSLSMHGYIANAVAVHGTSDVSTIDRDILLHGIRHALYVQDKIK